MMKRFLIIFLGLCLCLTAVSAQTFEELVLKSYEFADANKFSAAEECLKAAMRLQPTNRLNYSLLTNLGICQWRQRKLDEALVSFSAALSQMPKEENIIQNRAELLTDMGEIEKAIGDYNALLIISPTNEKARYLRGLLYINTGKYLLAEADFEDIIQTNKDTFLGRFGYAILEKARGKYTESEVIFTYLLDKYPDNLRVLEERAELFFLTSRNGRAMNDLNKVFAASSTPSAELLMLRGRIKLAQKEKESAAVDFKKARDLGYNAETVERLLKECF